MFLIWYNEQFDAQYGILEAIGYLKAVDGA